LIQPTLTGHKATQRLTDGGVSPSNPTVRVSVVREDASAPVVPQLTVEVADVDAATA
jgi:hypothetical protein